MPLDRRWARDHLTFLAKDGSKLLEVSCPHCGHTFPLPIDLSVPGSAIAAGVMLMRCPHCGRNFEKSGARFENIDGLIKEFALLEPTREELEAIARAFASVPSTSPLEAARAAAEAAPRFEPFFEEIESKGWDLSYWLKFIAALLLYAAGLLGDERLADQARGFGYLTAAAGIAAEAEEKRQKNERKRMRKARRRR